MILLQGQQASPRTVPGKPSGPGAWPPSVARLGAQPSPREHAWYQRFSNPFVCVPSESRLFNTQSQRNQGISCIPAVVNSLFPVTKRKSPSSGINWARSSRALLHLFPCLIRLSSSRGSGRHRDHYLSLRLRGQRPTPHRHHNAGMMSLKQLQPSV